MPTTTRPFDPAAYLDTNEAVAAYLTDARVTNDPSFIADALGVIAHAHDMARVARGAGLSRESLYGTLSPDGNLELPTLLRVIDVLGLRLTVRPTATANPAE